MTQFQEHGEFKAQVEGRFIISEVVGPWNRELVDRWARELHPLALALSATGPHVGIAHIRGSLLCPPDALERMGMALRYAARHLQCIGNVLVTDADVEGRVLMQSTYAKLYEPSSPHRFFLDMESGRQWARQLLAERGFPQP